MSKLRALWAVPLLLALPGTGTTPLPREPHLTPAAAYLPRLVAGGGAPTAALPARRGSPAPYDTVRSTGPGIRRTDRFRAGSVTTTSVAVVVLQLAGPDARPRPVRLLQHQLRRSWARRTARHRT